MSISILYQVSQLGQAELYLFTHLVVVIIQTTPATLTRV